MQLFIVHHVVYTQQWSQDFDYEQRIYYKQSHDYSNNHINIHFIHACLWVTYFFRQLQQQIQNIVSRATVDK